VTLTKKVRDKENLEKGRGKTYASDLGGADLERKKTRKRRNHEAPQKQFVSIALQTGGERGGDKKRGRPPGAKRLSDERTQKRGGKRPYVQKGSLAEGGDSWRGST